MKSVNQIKSDKKLKAVIDGKKTVHFGAAGMSDYTKHKDPERKERYIERHKKNEDWGKAGLIQPDFTVSMFFGTSPLYKHLLMT